jgi:hypothetical protein
LRIAEQAWQSLKFIVRFRAVGGSAGGCQILFGRQRHLIIFVDFFAHDRMSTTRERRSREFRPDTGELRSSNVQPTRQPIDE